MTSLVLLFDALLCLVLLALSVAAVSSKRPAFSIVLYIVFGLFMAVVWARLAAPDLALTEAALGAGLLGALFWASWGSLNRLESSEATDDTGQGGFPWRPVLYHLAVIPASIGAAWFLCAEGAPQPVLADRVLDVLPRTGVSNPVTAVILSLRAYDTFLELGVLLLAVLAVRALVKPCVRPPDMGLDAIVASYGRAMGPLLVLVAGYLLWAGGYRPGGAFQAGSILAGAGVMGILAGILSPTWLGRPLLRGLLALGCLVFLLLGLLMIGWQGGFLHWPEATAKYFILVVELAAVVSIGLSLVLLFAACAGRLESASSQDGGAAS